jgi:hypothetical protein
MNRAQQKLVGAGAVVAALLGVAAVRELSKPGLNCRDDIHGFVDRSGRWVMVKAQVCK